jgi:Oxaloacetate decarboxylase, gamma chain.
MLFAEESGAGLQFTGGAAATSTLITFLLGIGIVFIGLIALILIIKVMGAVMKSVQKKRPAVERKRRPNRRRACRRATGARSLRLFLQPLRPCWAKASAASGSYHSKEWIE